MFSQSPLSFSYHFVLLFHRQANIKVQECRSAVYHQPHLLYLQSGSATQNPWSGKSGFYPLKPSPQSTAATVSTNFRTGDRTAPLSITTTTSYSVPIVNSTHASSSSSSSSSFHDPNENEKFIPVPLQSTLMEVESPPASPTHRFRTLSNRQQQTPARTGSASSQHSNYYQAATSNLFSSPDLDAGSHTIAASFANSSTPMLRSQHHHPSSSNTTQSTQQSQQPDQSFTNISDSNTSAPNLNYPIFFNGNQVIDSNATARQQQADSSSSSRSAPTQSRTIGQSFANSPTPMLRSEHRHSSSTNTTPSAQQAQQLQQMNQSTANNATGNSCMSSSHSKFSMFVSRQSTYHQCWTTAIQQPLEFAW